MFINPVIKSLRRYVETFFAKRKYKKEKCDVIPMRPYLDAVFSTENRDSIIALFHARAFYFRDLITQKKFKKAIELLKPKG